MYFVGSNRDLYYVSMSVVMYAIECYIGPRYNGNRLYFIFYQQIFVAKQTFVDD